MFSPSTVLHSAGRRCLVRRMQHDLRIKIAGIDTVADPLVLVKRYFCALAQPGGFDGFVVKRLVSQLRTWANSVVAYGSPWRWMS
jgi:hypothetical protein